MLTSAHFHHLTVALLGLHEAADTNDTTSADTEADADINDNQDSCDTLGGITEDGANALLAVETIGINGTTALVGTAA